MSILTNHDICQLILDHQTPRSLGLLACTCKTMAQKTVPAWQTQAELIFGTTWEQIARMTEIVHEGRVFRVPRTPKDVVRFETEDLTRVYGWESWVERDLNEIRRRVDLLLLQQESRGDITSSRS